VLLFKGARKSETTLKSEYAFSGVVVKYGGGIQVIQLQEFHPL